MAQDREWALDPKYEDRAVYEREFVHRHPWLAGDVVIDRETYLRTVPKEYKPSVVAYEEDLVPDEVVTKEKVDRLTVDGKCEFCGREIKGAVGMAMHRKKCIKDMNRGDRNLPKHG